MNGDKEVVTAGVEDPEVVQQAGMPTLLEREIDVQKATARIKAIAQVIDGAVRASLVRTVPKDWVKMRASGGKGENFYLGATGVEKIRPVWGIYFEGDITMRREQYENGSYAYVCEGRIGSRLLDQLYGQSTINAEGSRSSQDPFFKNRKEGTIDQQDVRKAAYANFMVRSVSILLGLRNMDEKTLKELGIRTEEIPGFEFQQESTGDEKGMQKAIGDWLLKLGGDMNEAKRILVEVTAFTGKDGKHVSGVSSCTMLTGRRLEVVYGKVKKMAENAGIIEQKESQNVPRVAESLV